MILEIKNWDGGISSHSDRGQRGSAKMLTGLDIRKTTDTLTCNQALTEEGLYGISHSSSASLSPSGSLSPSASGSPSTSPSATASQSNSPSSLAIGFCFFITLLALSHHQPQQVPHQVRDIQTSLRG